MTNTPNKPYKHASLFSGIGGFDLASQWMGWENVFHCEINPFCQRILKYYFPNSIPYGDITTTDFSIWRGKIDILTGGFPCQPFSLAGKRKGTEDDRHLWPQMLRAVKEIQPRVIVGENVPGIVNWSDGLVFEQVCADLENEGYEVQPVILPACGLNAPHKRYRVWFVAYNHNFGRRSEPQQPSSDAKGTRSKYWWCYTAASTNPSSLNSPIPIQQRGQDETCNADIDRKDESGDVANAISAGRQEQHAAAIADRPGFGSWMGDASGNITNAQGWRLQERDAEPTQLGTHAAANRHDCIPGWDDFPTQSPVCGGNDGFSAESHFDAFSNEDKMDRNLVIKGALDAGRLITNHQTGKIYSTCQRGKSGLKKELPGADCNGYVVHNIFFNGVKKQCRAHQIVWISANGLYDKNLLMIDHIDRDRKNNILSNLRLVTPLGNAMNRVSYEGKLSQIEKDRIFFLHKEGHNSMRELAEDFGISKSRVHQLITEHGGLDGITFPSWRQKSISGFGNAIVPQIAFEIFKAIEQTL